MLKNIFKPLPKRIVKNIHRNGGVTYTCQKFLCNEWTNMTDKHVINDYLDSVTVEATYNTLDEAKTRLGIELNPIIKQEEILKI